MLLDFFPFTCDGSHYGVDSSKSSLSPTRLRGILCGDLVIFDLGGIVVFFS